MVFIWPIGSREGMTNFFFEKSVFVKHPSLDLDRDLVTRRGQRERPEDIQAQELQRKVTNGPVPVFGYE